MTDFRLLPNKVALSDTVNTLPAEQQFRPDSKTRWAAQFGHHERGSDGGTGAGGGRAIATSGIARPDCARRDGLRGPWGRLKNAHAKWSERQRSSGEFRPTKCGCARGPGSRHGRKALIGAAIAAVLTAVGLTGGTASAVTATVPPILVGYGFTGLGDWDGDGYQDLVIGGPAGEWWLYPSSGVRGPSGQQPVLIGAGMSGSTFLGMGDWDSDGHDDIIFQVNNGDLLLYPGAGTRGPSGQQPVQIGAGFGGVTFVGMGDWDGDGYVDIAYRQTNGDLMLYSGVGRRGFGRLLTRIGNGFGGVTFVGMGDWDGDGHDDIAYRRTNGDLMLYSGTGTRGYGWLTQTRIGY